MKHRRYFLASLFVVLATNVRLADQKMAPIAEKSTKLPAGTGFQDQARDLPSTVTPISDAVRPTTVMRSSQDGQVNVIHLGLHFSTAIVMPEKVSSVVVGDPTLFKAEHSEKEPRLVFVKPLTDDPAQSNMVISTVTGQTMSLLLRSVGGPNGRAGPFTLDFLVSFRPPRSSFLIEETAHPSVTIPATVALDDRAKIPRTQASYSEKDNELVTSQAPSHAETMARLLKTQQQSPLPRLDGTGLRVKISRIYEYERGIYVLFSVVNRSGQNLELVPPQIQLSGKAKRRTGTSEQIPVRDYVLSSHKLTPGDRADCVVLFDKPPFKQSHEAYYLQIADSSAVDIPVLTAINLKAIQVLEGGVDDERR